LDAADTPDSGGADDLVVERSREVAADVAAQWELLLACWRGGMAALDGVEADTIRFPTVWFERWLAQLEGTLPLGRLDVDGE
jgi:hypothetical protein